MGIPENIFFYSFSKIAFCVGCQREGLEKTKRNIIPRALSQTALERDQEKGASASDNTTHKASVFPPQLPIRTETSEGTEHPHGNQTPLS